MSGAETTPRVLTATCSSIVSATRAGVETRRPTDGQRGHLCVARQRFSGGAPFVVMMQTAEMRHLNDPAARRWLHRPGHGRILVQREVRSPLVVIGEVLFEGSVQRTFVPHDEVVQALAPDGVDRPFHKGFCQGDQGAISTSSMPIASAARRNSAP